MNTQVRGRREREARKRHRRGYYWNSSMPAGSESLKLGHSHLRRRLRIFMADSEKPGRLRRNELRPNLAATSPQSCNPFQR